MRFMNGMAWTLAGSDHDFMVKDDCDGAGAIKSAPA